MPFKIDDGVKKYTRKEVVYDIENEVIVMRPLTLEKVGKIFEEISKEGGDLFGDTEQEGKEKENMLELMKDRLDNPNLLTIILKHILVKKADSVNVTNDFIKKNFEPELYKEIWDDFVAINEKEFLVEQVIPFVIAMSREMKGESLTKLAGKKSVSSQLTE